MGKGIVTLTNSKKAPLLFIPAAAALFIMYRLMMLVLHFFQQGGSGVYAFDGVTILYGIAVCTYVLVIIGTTGSDWDLHGGLYLFLFFVLFLLLFVPFGVDLTDEGEQMSTAWFMFHGSLSHSYNYYKIGSWWLNGLWLSIIGQPLLIWDRVGGTLIMAAMGVVVYQTLKYYSRDVKVLVPAVVVSFIFVVCHNHPETKIDHSNLPTLLLFISFYLYSRYMLVESQNRYRWLLLSASSFTLLISVLTRFPHILYLAFPFSHFVVTLVMRRSNRAEFGKRIAAYYGVPLILLVAALGAGAVIAPEKLGSYAQYLYTGFFKGFLNVSLTKITWSQFFNAEAMYKQSYLVFLFSKYMYDAVRVAVLGGVLLVVCLLFGCVDMGAAKSKWYNYFHAFLVFVLGVFCVLLLVIKGWTWYIAPLALFILYPLSLFVNKKGSPQRLYFFIWGWLIFITSFVGSNNSFRHSVPSGAVWLLAGFIIVLLSETKPTAKDFEKRVVACVSVFLVAMLLVCGYKRVFDNGKRDKNIVHLTTMYHSPELWGLFSDQDRVEAIDGIISAVKKNVGREESVITYGSVPLLHYLTNTDYYWGNPWTEQLHVRGMEEATASGKIPDVIIYAKKSARETAWPATDIIYDPQDAAEYTWMQTFIQKEQYQISYQNNGFILYTHDKNVIKENYAD